MFVAGSTALLLAGCSASPVASTHETTLAPPAVVSEAAPTLESTPTQGPAPATTVAAVEGPSTGKAALYNMTDAEYQAIVDSFTIDAAAHTTHESVINAFNEKMTAYFNGGQNRDDHTRHDNWSVPDTHPGWNSWAGEVYTSAILEGLFTKDYIDKQENYIEQMLDVKSEANRMWANTNRANQPGYEMAFEFKATSEMDPSSANSISAAGELTYTDNAADNSETATDSHAIASYTFSDTLVVMMLNQDTNTWQVIRIKVAK